MKLSDYDYSLPKNLIAKEPADKRDHSHMMIIHTTSIESNSIRIEHGHFYDILKILKSEDVLVLNDTQTLQCNLIGKKITGGKVKCMILQKNNDGTYKVLLHGKKINIRDKIYFSKSNVKHFLIGTVLERIHQSEFRIRFNNESFISKMATLPIPPYIGEYTKNQSRYQTIYCKQLGSIATPTAGLHFTKNLLLAIQNLGVEIIFITLHIGIGTFQPITTENVEDWKMHKEEYHISKKAEQKINHAILTKKRIFAVGTTCVKTLESACYKHETKDIYLVKAEKGTSSLFISPEYKMKIRYAGLITNFHLPKSSLLLLVCSFYSKEQIMQIYQKAIEKKYRFYSFGDAMILLM